MGHTTFESESVLNEFIDEVKADPSTEILPTNSEWEAFRYRREEMVGPINGEQKGTGSWEYGIVYRNKKGRLNFTGVAESDFREWKGLRQ